MIRIIIKYSFHFTLPLLILTLLMKFGFINEYLNTDYLFPIISILFFTEIYCRIQIDKKNKNCEYTLTL